MSLNVQLESIIKILEQRGETVVVAESVTAGGIGHALTSVPGASKVFLGGFIAYTNEVKSEIVGVDSEDIKQFGVVSEEVACAMADGAREKFGATWGIASTGIAGPGDYQGVPEGTVWVAIRGPINQTLHLLLDGGREGIRRGSISSAIATFARILSYRSA